MSPSSRYATCAGYEIHYMDWGDPGAPVVIAWHGLARTGRDMDELAAYLSTRYRVICPDTLGRGLSQWSRAPAQEYCLAFYARLAADLFAQLGIDRAHWVGTSMGGAIGTVCAAGHCEPRLRGRIRSLLLNDNAPQLADAALALYWQTGNFTVLHMVTGSRAAAIVSRHLPPELRERWQTLMWQAVAAAYITVGAPPLREQTWPDLTGLDWPEILPKAIASLDDHVIKLVHCCWRERTSSPHYLAVAARAVGLLDAECNRVAH